MKSTGLFVVCFVRVINHIVKPDRQFKVVWLLRQILSTLKLIETGFDVMQIVVSTLRRLVGSSERVEHVASFAHCAQSIPQTIPSFTQIVHVTAPHLSVSSLNRFAIDDAPTFYAKMLCMKLRIIGNPIAGGGKARPRIEELTRLLRADGHVVDVQLTTKAGDARAWAADIPDDIERLIVAGGDGTLNEVLNGLADPSRTPLVQMPVGTANVLARELKFPWTPQGVANLVNTGIIKRVDLCEARKQPTTTPAPAPAPATAPAPAPDSWHRFLVVMSSGFDAMVIEDIHHNRKGKLGFFGYMKPIWRTIRRYNKPTLRVSVDGAAPIEGAMIVVANAANYAGLFTVAHQARMDSGELEICVMQEGSITSLIGFAFAAWRRKLAGMKGVTFVKGKSLTIESDQPVAVEVDGEWFGFAPVEVRLTPAVVPIVVPVS